MVDIAAYDNYYARVSSNCSVNWYYLNTVPESLCEASMSAPSTVVLIALNRFLLVCHAQMLL